MPLSSPAPQQVDRQLAGGAIGLVGVVLLLASAASGYVVAVSWVEHTLRVREHADDWLISLFDVRGTARDMVLSGETSSVAALGSARSKERKKAAALRHLIDDSDEQVRNFDAADRDALETVTAFSEVAGLAQAGHRAEAIAQLTAGKGKRAMASYRARIGAMRAHEERLLQERSRRAQRLARLTGVAGLLLTLASTLLLVIAWRRGRSHDALLRRLAGEARSRLTALFDLATALSDARSRTHVADVVVDRGMKLADADTCTLYALNEAEHALDLIGVRGVAAPLADKLRRLTEGVGSDRVFEQLRTNSALWAETQAEYAQLFPAYASLKLEGPRAKAFWSMPLYVEGRAVGLLGMGFYKERAFSADDRAFVEAFTKQCAQALLRADRLHGEDEANRWFTTTLRSIGDAVIATDSKGRVQFMNPVAEALTQWEANEARGRPIEEVFCILAEQTRAPVESPVTKVLRDGKVVGLVNHTVLRSRSGIEIPIDDSGAPIRTEDGAIIGVVLVFRDVTREKRERVRRDFLAKAGAALVSSLDYEHTLNTVAQLTVPVLADWCAIDIVEPLSGTRRVAVAHVDAAKVRLARELAVRYPPDPNAPTGAAHVIRTGESELYPQIPAQLLQASAQDADHLRILEELRLESAIVVPLRTARATLGAITFIYADSARRYGQEDLEFAEDFARRAAVAIENALTMRQAEQARAQEEALRAEAEGASRAKDEFLATVSHELRTPLNAILGWTVILRDRKPEPELDRGLAIIERNARIQAKLIEDVLDVSRIISGKLALNMTSTNVADAVETAIETVMPAAAAKNITISAELAERELTIVADPDRLQQVVWNLLANAVKFTPKSGNVTVRVSSDGSDVVIAVSDSGEGIAASALPYVFEPFLQADSTTTRRHGGLGLGLAIVKQLVTAHGGTVASTSEGPGKGATFTVRLPARSAIAAIRGAQGPTQAAELHAARLDQDAPRLDGMRILVVDDEEDARAVVVEVLSSRGAQVQSASSVQEALTKLKASQPDLIVSDIGMPTKDGYSLIREVRALSPVEGARVPAIALTAYARAEDAQRALAAGFQSHLAKPVEPAELARAAFKLVRRTE